MTSLVPHIENSEKKDHEVPAVTENGMVWKSPGVSYRPDGRIQPDEPPRGLNGPRLQRILICAGQELGHAW